MQKGSPLNVGDIVGDAYVVEKLIGAGGMAFVHLASHREYRHRVAIKILRPENSRRNEVAKRFEREQRTLTMLHSEHTLRIYGFGNHQGLPYMLLEYLEGKDLEELIKNEGPLPLEMAAEYLLQACHAIAEAHLLGVVHRDLKPGNLFLTRRTDGSPCIKVLDFGISKVSQESDGLQEPSLVTRAHAVMGSPFYMPPEQMLSSANVDARSDIWSLGVTLYEILTKALPFAADSPAAVCRRIMGDAPTPLRRLSPSFPEALEEVINRCLQKRAEHRFGNITDFAVRLGEFAPAHCQHAVEKIRELIAPTETPAIVVHESARTVPLPTGSLDSHGSTSTETSSGATVYLPQGSAGSRGVGAGTLIASVVLAFALGTGLGWSLNLETDPMGGSKALPATRPPLGSTASATASPQPSSGSPSSTRPEAPATSAAPSEEAPSEPPIDLDGAAPALATPRAPALPNAAAVSVPSAGAQAPPPLPGSAVLPPVLPSPPANTADSARAEPPSSRAASADAPPPPPPTASVRDTTKTPPSTTPKITF